MRTLSSIVMACEYIIQIPESVIDDLVCLHEGRMIEIRDLLAESSQYASALSAAIEGIDFEELALVEAVKPYEKLIEQLGIDHCGFDCEAGDGNFWDVAFSFAAAEHAAMFEEAILPFGRK